MNTSRAPLPPAWLSRCLLAWACTLSPALAQTSVLINPGDQGEQSRMEVFGLWQNAVRSALAKVGDSAASIHLSTDATQDLQGTRSHRYDLYVAPAHVIGSAIRYGYTPLVGQDRTLQAVLVAPTGSDIASLAQAAGKKLGLPGQDSLVTYLVQGEINAHNTTLQRYFHSVYMTRYQDALLVCLQMTRCETVAVEKSLAERWIARKEPVRIVWESSRAPGLSAAVRKDSKLPLDALRSALTEALAASQAAEPTRIVATNAGDFQYVATLGYFTPRTLEGATVVDARTVAQLLKDGAQYIDTRSEEDFRAGHVAGAKLVPYLEKSGKNADYDDREDRFDTSRLPGAPDSRLIFACNGPECWKSYKAARSALKAGFTQVYWFRGGLPEWREAGLNVVTQN